MIIALASLTFQQDVDEETLAAAKRVEDICRALPGCQRYELSKSVTSPSTLLATEVWDDFPRFEAHIAQIDGDESLSVWRERLAGVTATAYEASELPAPPTDTEDQR
jgi:quinol monooxygenase YgiN